MAERTPAELLEDADYSNEFNPEPEGLLPVANVWCAWPITNKVIPKFVYRTEINSLKGFFPHTDVFLLTLKAVDIKSVSLSIVVSC